MNKAILSGEVQEFIDVNLRIETAKLLFKSPVFEGVTNKELVEQIVAKRKAKTKLPTWFDAVNIYFPPKISIEQTSSEETARYKSSLISGKNLIDITGGFGVDNYYFSQVFHDIIHCELNQELSQIATYNFSQLGVENCKFIAQDGLEFLQETESHFDWIFLDPGRRTEAKGKVFLLKDCLPDVPGNLDLLFSRTSKILIKTSPLIDISQGISELAWVKEVHVVALNNEVKELLWILEKDFSGEISIQTVNLKKEENESFAFNLNKAKECESRCELPSNFLYEPNAAILKSGAFNQVGIQFGVSKLHKHSHLYSSNELLDFPGRRFQIIDQFPAKGKELKTKLKGKKANVTTRNYPQKVEEIRKSLKIKEGGEVYLFFTTNFQDEKICLICRKVN